MEMEDLLFKEQDKALLEILKSNMKGLFPFLFSSSSFFF
jgi:hypothetical protein